jgi:DNA-binding CsgD family transcriptional regulator
MKPKKETHVPDEMHIVRNEQTSLAGYQCSSLFTDREKELIALILEAHPRKIIAALLGIKVTTVSTHLRHIHTKTETHSIPELIRYVNNMK